jgi:hypothetical protein
LASCGNPKEKRAVEAGVAAEQCYEPKQTDEKPLRQELLQNSVMNPNRLTKTVKFYLSSG